MAQSPRPSGFVHFAVLSDGEKLLAPLKPNSPPEPDLSGGAVKFWAVSPSTGVYRMFFDFQVNGAVHTASFTLTAQG